MEFVCEGWASRAAVSHVNACSVFWCEPPGFQLLLGEMSTSPVELYSMHLYLKRPPGQVAGQQWLREMYGSMLTRVGIQALM